MAEKQIYEMNTTDGKRYGVGLLDSGEMLASVYHGTFRTRKGAEKKLLKLMEKVM